MDRFYALDECCLGTWAAMTKLTLSRRKLIVGVGALIAAPAIVRYASLMPVKTPAEALEVLLSGNLPPLGDLLQVHRFSGGWVMLKRIGDHFEVQIGAADDYYYSSLG